MSGEIIEVSDPGGKGTGFRSDIFVRFVNYEQPRLARYHQLVDKLIKLFR